MSKYFSPDYSPLPTGWTSEEFWWAVEKLEKLENNKLFLFCLDLEILNGKTSKESVSSEIMVKEILYKGDKNRILDILKKTGGFISEYLSISYSPLPEGWTPEEFWWAVEQLEKYGDEYNLFDLADSLGIGYDKKLKGRVGLDYLIIGIIDEGGDKDKVVEAIKKFVEKEKK